MSSTNGGPWKVVAEPQGNNPSVVQKVKAAVGVTEPENTGGMVIFITDGTTKQEVSRVAWIRREAVCKNPKNSLDKQLRLEVGRAQDAATMLNELVGDGTLQ